MIDLPRQLGVVEVEGCRGFAHCRFPVRQVGAGTLRQYVPQDVSESALRLAMDALAVDAPWARTLLDGGDEPAC